MFDAKTAFVVRNNLVIWRKLNVSAFPTLGLLRQAANLPGKTYPRADASTSTPLIQPGIVLRVGHDATNREAVKQHTAANMNVVDPSLRDSRKVLDEVTKGARM